MAPFQITIQKHFKPFSKRPGSSTLIPGSSISIEAFPTKIRFYNIERTLPQLIAEIDFKFSTSLESFSLMLDLEKEAVLISGMIGLQPFRLKISAATLFSIDLHFLKTTPLSFTFKSFSFCQISNSTVDSKDIVKEGDILHLLINKTEKISKTPRKFEKLSLGCHQKQDIDRLNQKPQFNSILPLWLKLASSYQNIESHHFNHPWKTLLSELRCLIEKKEHDKILCHAKKLFQVGFNSLLCPRLIDTDFQGIADFTQGFEKNVEEISPLVFLKETAGILRTLFIQTKEDAIILLPHLPPEFFCGRFINVSTPVGLCNFEWTKKMVRRVTFHASNEGTFRFIFPSPLKSFRLRSHKNEKGVRISCEESFQIKSGLDYFLDQFQK